MHSIFALSAAAFAGLAAAQTTAQNNYPYRIDPSSVTIATRNVWCSNQKAQCPLICLQQPGVTSMTTLADDCDPQALTYSCVCENNVSPNVTQYSQTLPFYICQEWGNQCVAACGSSNTCANACRADHPCGAQSPYLGNTSIPSTSSASATAASTTTKIPVTGFGGTQPSASSTPGKAAGAAVFVPSAGVSMAALAATIFFGFAVLL